VKRVADGRARLLVVEDDEAMSSALERGLAAEGFAVTVASDGVEGLALTEGQRFDAIVLDLMLPGLNGFRLCRLLRERGDPTPVLVLTAKQGEFDEAEALETGADDYLRKPFSFVILLARLHALLRRGARAGSTVLRAGDLALDPTSHRCWRGDTAVDLTPREFALLEALMARCGEPVGKRDLVDEVWDWAMADGSNLVEVYIGYLRRKIDAPFGRQAIETVRGVGYRLDPDGG
jgi:two-component system OmpR family response regulator